MSRRAHARGGTEHALLAVATAALVTATTALVSPVGEYALNDDWIHAKVVQSLLLDGHYRGHPYVAATLVGQAYWGALFCKVFGFSFTALRISTLVLAAGGAWATMLGARAVGTTRPVAVLAGATVFACPIALNLAYSFMTDVPFLALSACSGYLLLRALGPGADSRVWALGGGAVGGAAYLVRQPGFIPLAAFCVALVVAPPKGDARTRRTLLAAALVPWVPVVLVSLRLHAMQTSGNSIFEPLGGRVAMSLVDGVRHIPIALCYLGLFSLPVTLPLFLTIRRGGGGWRERDGRLLVGCCLVSFAAFVLPAAAYWTRRTFLHQDPGWLARYPYRMPLLGGDYLLDLALGHDQLPDSSPAVSLGSWWWPLTVVAAVSGGLLLVSAVRAFDRGAVGLNEEAPQGRRTQAIFLACWGALMVAVAYNPWRVRTFDRYLLPALPPAVILVARELRRLQHRELKAAVACWAVLFALAIVGVQDYLGWNRAAWTAETRLIGRGVPSAMIRGADAANGWYNSDAFMRAVGSRRWQDANVLGRGPWTTDDRCVITPARTRPGYKSVAVDEYFSWLALRPRRIVTYCRCDGDAEGCEKDAAAK